MNITGSNARLSRSPHGERGLKLVGEGAGLRCRGSLSSRRAWIEIPAGGGDTSKNRSRSPHGERGLKYWVEQVAHGVR